MVAWFTILRISVSRREYRRHNSFCVVVNCLDDFLSANIHSARTSMCLLPVLSPGSDKTLDFAMMLKSADDHGRTMRGACRRDCPAGHQLLGDGYKGWSQ